MKTKFIHPLRYSIHTRLREFHLKKLIPVKAGGNFLDMGCGLGYLTQALKQNNRAYGLDYDLSSLKSNMDRGLRHMMRGDATQIPIKDRSLDIIVCSEVLEHLPDESDARALAEMARTLKPGGRILVTVPCLEGIRAKSKLRNLGHDDPDGGEYHYRMGYTLTGVKKMVAGIPLLRIRHHRYAMFLLSELFMDFVKLVFSKKSKLKDHSDIMSVKTSFLFKVYRFFFPVFYCLFIVEDLVCAHFFRGHILVLSLERKRSGE